jgi:hypothetical protein
MAWVRCLIRGENFPIDPDGKGAPINFLATRYVDVNSIDDVERVALAALKQSPELQVPPGTPGMEKARVFFEIIEPVEEPEGSNTGFEFFREER